MTSGNRLSSQSPGGAEVNLDDELGSVMDERSSVHGEGRGGGHARTASQTQQDLERERRGVITQALREKPQVGANCHSLPAEIPKALIEEYARIMERTGALSEVRGFNQGCLKSRVVAAVASRGALCRVSWCC